MPVGLRLCFMPFIHQHKKIRPLGNRMRVRTPGVRPAHPIRLVRLYSPFITLWHPLGCNTSHFCCFLCESVHSPLPYLMLFIFLHPSSLHSMTSHFCSFRCGSVRSPLPSTPFIFSLTVFLAPHNLPLLLFSLRTGPQSALPPDTFHLPPYPFPFKP